MKHLIALNDTGQCYCVKKDGDNYGWQEQASIYQAEYSDPITELVFDNSIPNDNVYDIFIIPIERYGATNIAGTQFLFSFNNPNRSERKYYYLRNNHKFNTNDYILISLNENNKLSLKIYYSESTEPCSFRYRVINNFETKQIYRPFFTIDEKYKCLGTGNFTNDNKMQYCLHPSLQSRIENGYISTTRLSFEAPILNSILYNFEIDYIKKDAENSNYTVNTTFSLGLDNDRNNGKTIYKVVPLGELNLDGSFKDYISIGYKNQMFTISHNSNIEIQNTKLHYMTF